jgi:gamma-glutamyltranspeptidase/glutathione hydrolase
MGHNLEVSKRTTGRTNSIMLDKGWRFGATDTRRPEGWVAVE